jgi:hypothetical protein
MQNYPELYRQASTLCGNAAQFQGDERDGLVNFAGG